MFSLRTSSPTATDVTYNESSARRRTFPAIVTIKDEYRPQQSVITQHIFFSSVPFAPLDRNRINLFRPFTNNEDDLLDFDKVISSQGNKTGLEL